MTALALVLALVGTGLPGAPRGVDEAVAKQTGTAKVDEFLIIDCLLPGQVRRLGSRLTFLAPRRPVKTSARDCEIRGGEYVAFDRANYATALKVWLAPAQQGDADAQTYVGEIFEKGLGVPPDYGAAAEWYRRAAAQGHSRAAINLGNLYERGLGVPKDPSQALQWYRRAAGLPDVDFQITAPTSGAAAEVQQLREQVAGLKRDLQTKQDELNRTLSDVKALRQQLEQRGSEAERERTDVARMRKELEASRAKGKAATAELRDLERLVAEGEARLVGKDRELGELRATLARLESESAARRSELERLRRRTAGTPPQIELIEPELVLTRSATATLPEARVPVAGERITVVGRVTSADGLLSVTVNGREEALKGGNLFRSDVAVRQPSERVRIVAVDRAGLKAVLEFVVANRATSPAPDGRRDRIGRPRPPKIAVGNYRALVIGNNEYRHLRKLKTAVNDAREVARVLESQYGFEVTLLLNADRYQTLSTLNQIRERLTDKDNFLIYYAGHGELDQRNQRGHWLPVDAEPNSSANWISNIAITDILNAMAVRQLLVVADSCYAGTLTRSVLGQLEPGISNEKFAKLLQLMAEKRSRMVMTSGGVEPVIDSAGGPHSAFAQIFLELLRSNVGVLSGQELFQLLRLRVTSVAHGVDVQQVPEYAPIKFAGHESGDFFFVRASNRIDEKQAP
ncbi:MAG TPA: caspase family protein [Methylomirabilota bacterium]|nr:caspase family protein [Methylomirabilota bacterium]